MGGRERCAVRGHLHGVPKHSGSIQCVDGRSPTDACRFQLAVGNGQTDHLGGVREFTRYQNLVSGQSS